MAVKSSGDDRVIRDRWFPSWFPGLFFCLTSALRVYYVLQPKNWWIMHPDEVYQALEVAHSEMYGYGFRAYEYNPPTEIQPDTPHIRKMERRHGMAALRSYLLPHAYVMVTWVLESVGLQFNPFLTWKVAHTVAASTLPLAVYRYVRVVFRSHDTACVAAILCVACAQLHALGTHTLVNSLLSAPVFWALSHLHTIINPQTGTERDRDPTTGSAKSLTSGSNLASQNKASTNGHMSQPVSSKQQSNVNKSKSKQKHQRTAQRQKPSGNGVTQRGNGDNNGDNNGEVSQAPKDQNGKAEIIDTSKNNSLNKGENGSTFKCSTLSSTQSENEDVYNFSKAFKQNLGIFLQNVLAGFVLGVCVYIRVDIAALTVLTLLPFWSPFRTRYLHVMVCLCGCVCGLVTGVLDDFWCYGWGVMTPYNWFRFNVERDYAAVLFGENDFHQYISEVFLDNVGIMLLSAVCCVCAVLCVYHPQPLPAESSKNDRKRGGSDSSSKQLHADPSMGDGKRVGLRCCWKSSTVRTSVSWLLLLTLYSSKGHKEMRFIHNVIVLILITWASLLQSGVSRLFPSPQTRQRVLAVSVGLFVFSQWQYVSHLTDNPKRGGNRMAFKLSGDTQDINQCLYYLYSRDDITGLFLDRNLYGTGGYTLLHKDVPVFTIFGENLMEFRKEDRLVERAKNFIGPEKNITVAYVAQFSNYITKRHSQHVFKYVLEDPRYNYFIASSDRNFQIFGLGEPVHRCRSFKIYRRPTKPSSEQQILMEHTLNLSPPTNATLLLHEADMLLYHGAWTRARDRFHQVLKADPSFVAAYVPLAYSYSTLGDATTGAAVMEECYAKFGVESCDKKRNPLIDLSQV